MAEPRRRARRPRHHRLPARLSGRLQPVGRRRATAASSTSTAATPTTSRAATSAPRCAASPSACTVTDRLLHPVVRTGPKGSNQFARVVVGRGARTASSTPIEASARSDGAEAILPYCYGGSNGLLTQDSTDARFFRRLGASRLLRTVCAAPTGAAAMALYGKMPSVGYEDYPHAKLIVMWGVNPSAYRAFTWSRTSSRRRRTARSSSSSIRARRRWREPPTCILPVRPGTDLPSSRSRCIRHLFETRSRRRGVSRRAHDRRRRAAREGGAVDVRARGARSRRQRGRSRAVRGVVRARRARR